VLQDPDQPCSQPRFAPKSTTLKPLEGCGKHILNQIVLIIDWNSAVEEAEQEWAKAHVKRFGRIFVTSRNASYEDGIVL
jgi:hypothetical protein